MSEDVHSQDISQTTVGLEGEVLTEPFGACPGRVEPSRAKPAAMSADDVVEKFIARERRRRPKILRISLRLEAAALLIAFVIGLGGGYLLRTRLSGSQAPHVATTTATLAKQINPDEGFKLPATYGDIGPQMLRAGVIDVDKFVQTYQAASRPLSEEQLAILQSDSKTPIVINGQNAYFMLNFFWALGLVNKNPILEQGEMLAGGRQEVGNFASTGGWTIGSKDATDLFASAEIVKLTPEQQTRLEEVANNVYRPCCGNPTSFPDCNHGMALLGLLELMASQGATVDQMFTAAKQVNAFWFPSQTLELATYFKAVEGKDFKAVDARRIVGKEFSSGGGFNRIHQMLASKALLPQAPGSGQSCGV